MKRKTNRPYRVEIYLDEAADYRWRMFSPNGENIANGGEGYSTRGNARRAARRIFQVGREEQVELVNLD